MMLLHIWSKVGKANIDIFAVFQLKPVPTRNLTFDLNSGTNDFSSEMFGKGCLKF